MHRGMNAGVALVFVMVAVVATWGIVVAATGYLIIPDHHEGVVGDNDVPVRATGLEAGNWYRINMNVVYHSNPRTPPADPAYCLALDGYVDWTDQWYSDGADFTHTFVAPLPECQCQILACVGLLYWDATAGDWAWNQDPRSTQCVDIWSDCVYKEYISLAIKNH